MLADFFSILLWNPVGEKNIKLSRDFGLAIRYPDQALTIRGEHGETVESPIECEPFEPLPILTNYVEMKARSPSLALRFDIR